MATLGFLEHSNFSVLAWRIPMDGGAWWAASPWGHKESDMTERPSTFTWFKKKKLPFLQPTCFKARTIFLPHTLSFPK